jgi:3-oxoadipate enol-lactonase
MTDVLMLHAFPLAAEMWASQVEALKAAGHTAIAPDLPGFGLAAGLAAPSLEQFARHAMGALDRAHVDRAVVCGLSMGGYVAFRLLAMAPERVIGLVLCDTRADPDSAAVRQRRQTQIERIDREGVGWLAGELLPALLSSSASDAVRTRARAIMATASAAGVQGALRALADRPDSTPLLHQIRVPTTVIVGSADGLTTPAIAREMAAAIPGAVVTELASAGHLSNLEAPAEFNAALLAAVRRA